MSYEKIFLLLTGNDDVQFRRASKLLTLLEKNDTARSLILISGLSAFEPACKVSIAKKYEMFLKSTKSDLPRIILEERSQDTLGNMVFSQPIIKKILAQQSGDIDLYLITEKYHLKRSRWLFIQTFCELLNRIRPHFIGCGTFSPALAIKDYFIWLALRRDFRKFSLNNFNAIERFAFHLNCYKSPGEKAGSYKNSWYTKAANYIYMQKQNLT